MFLAVALGAPPKVRAQAEPAATPARAEAVPTVAQQARKLIQDAEQALGSGDPQTDRLTAEALEFAQSQSGVPPRTLSWALMLRGVALVQQGKPAEGEPLLVRHLAMSKQLDAAAPVVLAHAHGVLGTAHVRQGHQAAAEAEFRQALRVLKTDPQAPPLETMRWTNELAWVVGALGRDAEAEALYKEALRIIDEVGRQPVRRSLVLANLAQIYQQRQQPALAESLLRQALTTQRAALPTGHPWTVRSLAGLAYLAWEQGRLAEAEAAARELVALTPPGPAGDLVRSADSLSLLASVLARAGRQPEADAVLQQVMALVPTLGALPQARLHSRLAMIHYDRGDHAAAEVLNERTLSIAERMFHAEHPFRLMGLANRGELRMRRGDCAGALPPLREVTSLLRRRFDAYADPELSAREAQRFRDVFFFQLRCLRPAPGAALRGPAVDEAFLLGQLGHDSRAAAAMEQMAVRFAGGDDELARTIKHRQDAARAIAQLDKQLMLADGPAVDGGGEARRKLLREQAARLASELKSADADLARRFPAFHQLTRPPPMAVAEVQALLRPDEALLFYAAGEELYAFTLTRNSASFQLLPFRPSELAQWVGNARRALLPDAAGALPPVDTEGLRQLHQALIAPVEAQLAGVRQLLVVPSAALQSLPFGLLIGSRANEPAPAEGLGQLDWLARRYATSVLPSVASLRAVRQLATRSRATRPFAGVGDPVLDGRQSQQRHVGLSSRQLFAQAATADAGRGLGVRLVDPEEIRRASALPETADELRALARALGATDSALWLGADATETRLKRADLADIRVLAFATHGLVAGELRGATEPGLVLTPPPRATLEDDGYLSASEVATLKLNADWVILSACNTASDDGSGTAEGFSGLAKAFFFAGARTLLVSHWPVETHATVRLTTTMLQRYAADLTLGKAQAHQQAILALLKEQGGRYAHPFYWAPFVVVGEGGR